MFFKKKSKNHSKATLNILDSNLTSKTATDYKELFRQIRTNIDYLNSDIKCITITSTERKEGKTTVAINLSYSFAAESERVLLIEGNQKNPALHKHLNLSNEYGLVGAFSDFSKKNKIEKKYMQHVKDWTFKNDLDVLTLGSIGTYTEEFMTSSLFNDYIQTLKKCYDMIIIDCDSVQNDSNVMPLSYCADGTVFIVSAQDTDKKEAVEALNLLRRNQVNILGGVLTKAE